jgi:hypothetical protein
MGTDKKYGEVLRGNVRGKFAVEVSEEIPEV